MSRLFIVTLLSEKAGLKLNVQKMKIMASSPIPSWQKDGEIMESVTDFIFLGSKITERKAIINLESIVRSRYVILPTKVCLGKAMVFPVVMYGCESWTIKKPSI